MSSNEKKTKKGKVVSSRYLQAAEKYNSDGASGETLKTQITLKRNETNLLKNKTFANKFSTPQSHTALPTFNLSVIPGATGYNPPKKDNLKQSSLGTTIPKNTTANASTFQKKQPRQTLKKLSAEEKLEEEIDINYSRYLLAVLMETKAKQSLKSRSTYALEKFYEAFQYIGILLKRRWNVEKELCLVSHQLKVQEHLEKQEKILFPLLELIPTFQKQYEEITISVDSVRHKLQTKDIVLPPDAYQGELLQLMEKVLALLGQILHTVDVNEITSTADSAKCFVEKAKVISSEMKRACENFKESRDLLLSETSLIFGSCTLKEE